MGLWLTFPVVTVVRQQKGMQSTVQSDRGKQALKTSFYLTGTVTFSYNDACKQAVK